MFSINDADALTSLPFLEPSIGFIISDRSKQLQIPSSEPLKFLCLPHRSGRKPLRRAKMGGRSGHKKVLLSNLTDHRVEQIGLNVDGQAEEG
jgi:hypothetical protein